MEILFASSEVVPFASTGGLGDVAAALPRELARRGLNVTRVMPLYGDVDRERFGLEPCDYTFHVPLGDRWFGGTVFHQEYAGVRTLFIYNDEFFARRGLYGHGGHGFEDNFERFLFFQKAIVRLVDDWGLRPDIIHCNDWQTGLVPMFLKYGIDGRWRGGEEKTLFTVHNLAHQGWAPEWKFPLTGLPPECYTMHTLEFYGEINTLKGGLVASTAINTVSPTYAREIQTPEFGCKLDGVLRTRRDVLFGILNGIDYDRWNPATDRYIAANYSAEDLSGKAVCKRALQEASGFRPDPDVPLIGVITRLVPQKGIDLMLEVMPALLERGVQFVLLGTGDRHYERAFREWMERRPEQVHCWIEFAGAKAHRIEAGADLFLMPSAFEPCGQNQLYSMRYGTIPVVHGVGGLEDTVVDYDQPGGTGFKFHGYTAENFLRCIDRALAVYADKRRRFPLIRRAMRQDFSVRHMGRDYIALYEKILRGL